MKKIKLQEISFLLVDDSISILDTVEDVIYLIMKMFPETLYKVDRFETVNSFMKHKKNNYDVAVIDWNLPDGKGSDVISVLNKDIEKNRETTKVLYSGSITIFTGMVDENMTIGEYAIANKVRYISKGEGKETITNYLIQSVQKIIKNEKNK